MAPKSDPASRKGELTFSTPFRGEGLAFVIHEKRGVAFVWLSDRYGPCSGNRQGPRPETRRPRKPQSAHRSCRAQARPPFEKAPGMRE